MNASNQRMWEAAISEPGGSPLFSSFPFGTCPLLFLPLIPPQSGLGVSHLVIVPASCPTPQHPDSPPSPVNPPLQAARFTFGRCKPMRSLPVAYSSLSLKGLLSLFTPLVSSLKPLTLSPHLTHPNAPPAILMVTHIGQLLYVLLHGLPCLSLTPI